MTGWMTLIVSATVGLFLTAQNDVSPSGMPTITSPRSATAVSGTSFRYQITATNNPTRFGAAGLPAGLSIDPAMGLISGATRMAGAFNVALTAANNAGSGTSTLAFTIAGAASSGPLPAFPGAQGGGALSVGGRGGAVYLVTNLNDNGEGSLRACVEASGPRTCIFRMGGTIALLSPLIVSNPFITIAGQTARGGGIQLTGPTGDYAPGNPALLINTHDVVVQYLRVRRGHNAGEICNRNPWSCGASVQISAFSPEHNPYNIILDHVSAEWSNYNALIVAASNAASTPPRSITVSHSIVGEALAGAGQVVLANFGGFSGQGPAIPDAMTDLDVHHTLFAGASHRMPLATVRSARFVNNFIYAWTYYPMRSKGLRDFIGNYFKYRSAQNFVSHEIQAWTEDAGNDTSLPPSFYLLGNVGPTDPGGTSNWAMTALAVNQSTGEEASSPLSTEFQRTSPIPTPADYIPIIADPVSAIASTAGLLLNVGRAAPYHGAGASRKIDCSGDWADARDPVDGRIISAVATGSTLESYFTYTSFWTSPRSQADLGGWPTLPAGIPCPDNNSNGLPDGWEAHWAGKFGLGTVLDPNGLNFGDGYTNLEHYIHGMNPSP